VKIYIRICKHNHNIPKVIKDIRRRSSNSQRPEKVGGVLNQAIRGVLEDSSKFHKRDFNNNHSFLHISLYKITNMEQECSKCNRILMPHKLEIWAINNKIQANSYPLSEKVDINQSCNL